MVKDLPRNKESGVELNEWRGEMAYERERGIINIQFIGKYTKQVLRITLRMDGEEIIMDSKILYKCNPFFCVLKFSEKKF